MIQKRRLGNTLSVKNLSQVREQVVFLTFQDRARVKNNPVIFNPGNQGWDTSTKLIQEIIRMTHLKCQEAGRQLLAG